MAEAELKVQFAGPYVSLQDGGRPGQMRFGVPLSGAMDRAALALANAALGNDPGAPGIEVSMGGLTLTHHGAPLSIAVAGGGFIIERGGEKFGAWCVLRLTEGQRLVIRPGPWGCWTYLALAGDLATSRWLGSAATHALSGLGGGKLASGQRLTISSPRPGPEAPLALPCPVWARPRHLARVVMGPQDRHFSAETLTTFQTATFYASSAFDRMGMRLEGPALAPSGALSIPSEPILRGAVQVTGAGVATLLGADHQTTGGYPKIATVISADHDALSQLRPRDALRFQPVTPEAALDAARGAKSRLEATIQRFRHISA